LDERRSTGKITNSSSLFIYFFDDAEADVLTKEEEADMYAKYKSVFIIVKKVDEMIAEIDWLESRDWYLSK